MFSLFPPNISTFYDSIMEGDESLQQFSPESLIEDPSARNAIPLLPHIVLFHGTADFSIPPDARFDPLFGSYCLDYECG